MARIRVLHVDDEPEFTTVTAEFLQQERPAFEVVSVHDAERALTRLETDEIDCVVSDYEMPDTSGLELLRAVRERDPDLPFILFTGKGSEEVASEAISAGVTDYLRKSVAPEQFTVLANRIENAVARSRAETTLTPALPGSLDTPASDETRAAVADIAADTLDRSPVGTLLLDETGQVVWANATVARFFGLDREGLVGRDGQALVESTIVDMIEAPAAFRDQAFASADPDSGVFECHVLPDEDREERWLQHWSQSLDAGPFPGGRIMHFFDVTPRKQLEEELRGNVAALREFHAIATDHEIPFAERLERILDVVRRLLGMDAGFFTHIHDDIQDIVAAEGDIETIVAGDSGPLDVSYCRHTLENETVTTVIDAETEMAGDPAYETFGLACYIGAPVEVDGEIHGTICFAGTEPREERFSEFERTYIGLLAEWLGYELTQRRAAAALERQNERLAEFASLVSHDLRSPLSVAQGYLGLAQEVGDDRHFERVEHALDRMNTIIEDVLALARLGGHVENPVPIDLAQLAEEAWDGVETAGATLVTEEGTIEGDGKRLLRLFENLFRNSVDHGGDGVTVRVGPLADGFYVADDGPGIPEDAREKVFEGGYTTSEQGTGFGLAIVREIAEGHGWTVSLTDSEAGGARFEFHEADADLIHE
ncbi:response regulator [Natronomonas sp. EA1]|uniref:hybrid sensor histidine kinase/response regulator n=1 Tax=Natronomonas sp. EA1 TaxID=3421655 RepID=UPI003EB98A73